MLNTPKESGAVEEASVDAVLQDLKNWRENKSSTSERSIPDKVWKKIFKLEKSGHRAATLRSLFSLNSQQYRKKHEQLTGNLSSKDTKVNSKKTASTHPFVPTQFGEVSMTVVPDVPSLAQAAKQNKEDIKHLKSTHTSTSTYLDTSTIIVECIRPDGHQLKIHTTHNKLDVIMQTFFKQEAAEPC